MICPRCEQDEIVKAKIKKIDQLIYICPECDATWLSNERIGIESFLDYGTYMKQIGQPQIWDELEVIGRI
jgi:Zn-finger nucleic acid-binding protein